MIGRLYMFPVFLTMDSPHSLYINLKKISYELLREAIGFTKCIYRKGIFLRELCVRVFDPHKTSLFRDHISHVGISVSNEKMVRANTQSVVASMANKLHRGDWAEVKLPTHATRNSIANGFVPAAAHEKAPIAVSVSWADPLPASVSFSYFLKESLENIARSFAFNHELSNIRSVDVGQGRHVGGDY